MSSYKSSGVDIQGADAWVEKIAGQLGVAGSAELRAKVKSGIGAYAAVYALGDQQWLATSCDGVGTKLLWTQEGLGRIEDLAQDLIAMNANDLLCVGARPLLFLDYLAVGSLALVSDQGPLKGFIGGLSRAAAESEMIVVGGETAQMPDIYGQQGYDLAGFAVGTLQPTEHLEVSKIQPGSELWGWTSSGPHSNGFTWLRKLFDSKKDATFIREHLMTPTRLYARDFLNFRTQLRIQNLEAGLQSAFHITGSGLLNLIRAQPEGRTVGFDLDSWPAQWPFWLEEVAKRSKVDASTLWTTFNMGFGFSVVLSAELVQKAGALLNAVGLVRLGRIISDPCVKAGGLELR